MIEVENLTKRYGPTLAVSNISFNVQEGEILGFLGPNGAGKTTTMRIITGFLSASSGRVRVSGFDVAEQPLEVKKRIGYLPENPPVYPDMTVNEYLAFVGRIKGVPRSDLKKRIGDVSEKCAVADVANRQIGKLSKGYRQRVGLAQALMVNPDVLILDEPTLGLDPLIQREFWRLIDEASGRGATVLLSSHVLAEVEAGCHRMGLVRAGHLVRAGSLDELREVRSHRLQVVLGEAVRPDDLSTVPGLSEISIDGARVECTVRGPVGPLLDRLVPLSVIELDSRELSLEEVFLREFERTP